MAYRSLQRRDHHIVGEDRPHQSTGYKTTAIPIVNFSSDDGTGYGVRAYLFDYDGSSIPYRRQYSLQAFFTTGGKWVHRALIDAPELLPGYRIEIEAVFEQQEQANYFGTGTLSDEELMGLDETQKTFRHATPGLRILAIRQLAGPWRWRGGLEVSHKSIEPNAKESSILTDLDPPRVGRNGGLLMQGRSALQYDTRDDYTNTTHGVLEEILLEYGFGGAGEYNGGRISYEHRHFHTLARGLVIAHRANADMTLGSVPFYEAVKLGGSSTVRGLHAGHVRGEGRLLFNGELRWRGVNLSRRQHIYTGLLIFADVGQIFERRLGPSLNTWRRGWGMGLRFLWQSTVVRADWARAGQRTGVYITFDQVF